MLVENEPIKSLKYLNLTIILIGLELQCSSIFFYNLIWGAFNYP